MDRLTPRERDVARLVAEGLTNEMIGAALGIKRGTVKMNVIKHLAQAWHQQTLKACGNVRTE